MSHKLSETESRATFDFTQARNKLLSQLEKYWIGLSPENNEYDFSQFHADLTSEVESGQVDDDYILFAQTDYLFNQNVKTIRKLILVSCTYAHLANIAYEQGHKEKAWSLLTQAFYYQGICSGYPGENSYLSPNKRREVAKSGGIARAKKYNLIKEEALRLLQEKTPQEGWPKKQKAIDTIRQGVLDYIEGMKDRNITLSSANIDEWLKKKLPKANELKKPMEPTYK
ncbi:MAG: hypothetical protein Q7U16_07655 [Agitococcus sp.]|nr:hypothetical protein [Agitococcus sp.]